MKHASTLLTGIIALCIIGCGGGDDGTGQSTEPVTLSWYGITVRFKGVCDGTGRDNATAYPTANSSPLVVVAYEAYKDLPPLTSDRYDENDVPEAWRATAVEDIELVACVYEQFIKVESCGLYVSAAVGSAYRQKHKVEVTLREAKTGTIVATTTLWGSEPAPCPETIIITSPTGVGTEYVKGSEVPFSEIQSWLTQYVEH